MSWPITNCASSAGPIVLPAIVQLPWASREQVRLPGPRVQSMMNSRRKASIRKAKYGAAMAAGLIVVSLVKRLINSVPLVNVVSRPVLGLFPTILMGPALGAAVVYGLEQGDMLAARHVVQDNVQHVRREFDAVVQDLSSQVQAQGNSPLARQMERTQGALESTARAATQAVSELERAVMPVLEREYRNIEPYARKTLQEAGVGGNNYR